MVEKSAYNWQSMDYKEISFLDKNLDASNQEQATLKQELRAYTAGRVNAFADGSAMIQNASEYKLVYALINDAELNGSANDGGQKSLQALEAFAKVKGFKNVSTGELDFYDPRSGVTAEEFKASMMKAEPKVNVGFKPTAVSGLETAGKKEIAGAGISQAAAEKLQEQMTQILDTHKMDAGAVQSMQEEFVKQAEGSNARAPYTAPEAVAEKNNEEKEIEKGKTDENALGSDLASKHFEIKAMSDDGADKVHSRQISEAMLAKESDNWQEYAKNNNVLAETLKEEKGVVTKLYEGVKEQKKGEYNAIIERHEDDSATVGGSKDGKKEPELGIFKQIMKSAKKEGHDKISVSAKLSEESKEKSVVAALSVGMGIDGPEKPKSVDLKKDYIKKLPPAERAKIRRYNVSQMTPEELKKYKKDRKLLLKTGRRKAEAALNKAQNHAPSLTQSFELGVVARSKMGPQNSDGREM